MAVILGYRDLIGIPACPCKNPGTYACMEQHGEDPLKVIFRCWCGSTLSCTFDDMEERTQFIKDNGGDDDSTQHDNVS